MDLAPGTVVENYLVEAPIGRGGVAVVYRVRHVSLGTLHALKVLTVSSPALRTRLVREGQAQAVLRHANVVGATDLISVAGHPGLVLELVDGPPLSALLGDRRLSVEQVDALGAGVLCGVAAAHQRGFVHRDLKPANVLVALDAGRLVPRVTDFGLARALGPEDERQTRTGASLGTPRYMAREQIRDPRVADTRSDVWALGVLLYELAAGRPPFDEADQLELYKAIDEARYTPLDQVRPELPRRILDAVAAALHPDPAARPQDAGELLERWGGPREAAAADLEIREIVESLSPVSSTSEHTPTPILPDGGATFAPGTTWALPALREEGSLGLEPNALVRDETPEPVASRADPGPPQPPALAEVRGGPPWGLVAALFALMIVTFGGVVLVLVLTLAREPVVAVAPVPPVPPVAQELAEAAVRVEPGLEGPGDTPAPGNRTLARSFELLLDARGLEAHHQASFVAAGIDDPAAEQVIGLGGMLGGRSLSALEDLEKGARAPVRADAPQAMLDGLVDPARLDAWLVEHPDDWVARAFRVWTAPTQHPEKVLRHLAELERFAPARALPSLLSARVAWREGRWADAQAALAEVAEVDPQNPELPLERARVALARGRFQEAADLLDPVVAAADPPVDTLALRVQADLALGRGAEVVFDQEKAPGVADARIRFHLAEADAHLRLGDRAAAWVAFDRADEVGVRYMRDERMARLRLEVAAEGLRLAVIAQDPPRQTLSLGRVRDASGAKHSPWYEAEAGRQLLVAEGLLAAARGRTLEARRRLQSLEATGAPGATLRTLREQLDGGGPGLRVDPDLMP